MKSLSLMVTYLITDICLMEHEADNYSLYDVLSVLILLVCAVGQVDATYGRLRVPTLTDRE